MRAWYRRVTNSRPKHSTLRICADNACRDTGTAVEKTLPCKLSTGYDLFLACNNPDDDDWSLIAVH